ncbi:MAG: peroxiredoxin-like family protein [Anaerolineales bacterium]
MTEFERSTQLAEVEWFESWQRGPTRLRWDRTPIQVGDPAPDFSLPDEKGRLVELRSFWSAGPALILFWRHFGCSCGLDRARRLNEEIASYRKAGGNVVIVGQGEPERAAAYQAKYQIPCPILSDPERRAYEAFGLLEGGPSQILFDAPDELLRCDLEAAKKLAESRRTAGRPMVDSPWQLPGEFVVDRGGKLGLTYRYQYCEDYPNPLVLVAALREARGDFARSP